MLNVDNIRWHLASSRLAAQAFHLRSVDAAEKGDLARLRSATELRDLAVQTIESWKVLLSIAQAA